MDLINMLEVKTPYGYRQFKLVKGDISTIDFPIDMLCVSAFIGGYHPVPDTVLGSLYQNRGIDLRVLAKNPELDLRDIQNSFIVGLPNDPFIKWLMCLEMVGTGRSLDEIIDSLVLTIFTAELKEIKIKSIMMPLLGTGNQQIEVSDLLGHLIRKIEYLLTTTVNVDCVYLVAFNNEQATRLNDTMNILLNRKLSFFPKSQIISAVGANIRHLVLNNIKLFQSRCYNELLETLEADEIRLFNLAITARRVCEHILNNVVADDQSLDLVSKISQLHQLEVPKWIISYFHMLRIFGNTYAHENKNGFDQMNEQDLIIALFGLERLLDFYLNYNLCNAKD